MFSFLSALPFLGKVFDFGTNITNKIIELKVQQSNAQTEQQRIAIGEQVRNLEIQRDIQIAEAQYNAKTNQLARFMFVIPVGIIVWTIMVWDKVVCKFLAVATQQSSVCTTDKLDTTTVWIMMTVIGFYFLQNIARSFKN